ncbi:MAG TPA: ABC transporter permease [Pyrinomonadaceae bacterium]|nr:ABC transporter permease [Pyrinomonadaceae bacterium]
MQSLLQDIRYGIRSLVKQPGFTAIAVITLALGIGANTAVFSVVNAVLLRALPYRDADRLVMVWEKNQRNEQNTVSPANLFDWQEQNKVFEGLAAFTDTRSNLTSDGEPEEIPTQTCTDNLFTVLGVNAMMGRTFTPEDGQPGRNNVVVISFALWQRRFGGDQNIIGRKVVLNAVEHTVVGVLPPDVKWHVTKNSQTGHAADLWKPWGINNELRQFRGRFVSAVARLKPGVTLQQAQAEMNTIASRLADQYKPFNAGYGVNVVPLRQQFAGEIRLALLVLMGAVGFVLLIACANVANLQLSRAAARQKEIAVRTALGAGRRRIVRQLLTESLLLAAAGGAAGLLLAWWGTKTLVSIRPEEFGDFQSVEISTPVLGFTFAVSVVTGVIFGLFPAFEASNIKLSDTLKEAGRSLAGNRRGARLRSALVVSEIALALVLLVGSGLLLRSFMRLQSVDTGFNAHNVLTMRVALPGSRYDNDVKRITFFTQALERMRTLPGVEAAGAINYTPFLGLGSRTSFEVPGRPQSPADQGGNTTDVCVTDQNFFNALQIPLRRGRFFSEQEVREQRHVVIINEALAKKYFPNEDALGKSIIIAMRPPEVPTEIIGIVRDAKHSQLDQDSEPMSYWPIAELPYTSMTFVLRTRGDTASVANAARTAIQTLDPQQPVADVHTLESLIGSSIARQRFNTLLLAIFAIIALLLSVAGIYGVVSYSVAQRSREIGIRTALGATAQDILRLVLKRGMTLTLLGIGIGLPAAIALTSLIKRLLFGVGSTDVLTFVSVSILLAASALLACYIPARRATRVDPLVALRYE